MIRFDHVSFHYGGEHGTGEGVDDIDLVIRDGETVVLCGESGCGKTTVTRLINGLAPHFYPGVMEGNVYINDLCVTTEELSAVSKAAGSVFQNPKSQFFNIDTTGELVFGCENQGVPREEIRKRLEKTVSEMKLESLMNRNIFELSGGEKQQIACGSVYTADPDVCVMDEPSSNLDKKAIHRLHDTLKRIKEQGKTLVISEHRLHYLMDLADRFIYLEDGRITKTFTAEELAALDDAELSAYGLRCTDLSALSADNISLPRASAPALEALDLTCVRGNHQILDIDRLDLPANSIVAMIGDNGCGKSTLSESLCGVIPSNGSVSFNGVWLTDKERYTQSFMVMQDVNRQLFSDSVMEEVMLNSDVSKERAEEILDRLGLGDVKDRHPASLSGGQKQRVAIAGALCAGKQILFYDEPTSGLDRRGMERFGSLLRDVRKDVLASVIITHDPELVLQCCTHVMQVENGRVLAVYPLDEDGVKRVMWYFLSESDESTSRRREKLSMIGKVLQYTGEWKKTLWQAVVFLVVGALAGGLPFLAVYDIIRRVVSGEAVSLQSCLPAVITVLVLEIIHALFYTFGLQLSHRAAYGTLENIRIALQEKIETQPLGNMQDMGTGALKKLFTEDVESVELLLAHMIPEGIANLSVPAVLLIILIWTDWQAAVLTLIMISFGLSASSRMYTVGMDRMGNYFAASKRLNNTIIEYVEGMEVVRIFGRDGSAEETFSHSVRNYRDFALDWYRVCWPWMALYGSIFSDIAMYSIPFGALMILTGYLPASRYILSLCICFAIGPMLVHCISFIGALPQVNFKIQSLEKAIDRLPLKAAGKPFEGVSHDVTFDEVRFGYKGDAVLKGLSFTAREGQMTALAGESGSGKSTAARLLAHYYDVVSGSVLIGGQDIREMSLDTLNHQIAYVSQELFLFNDTIMENIRIGKPDASDEEVREAARRAQCEEFIESLENGYETMAGKGGAKLSGGQRQRIAFARAILKDAPIIILDEATAFIDPENERRMNEAVHEIIRNKTVIIIAHRLAAIQNADKIVYLRDGKALCEGTHTQLLEHCPDYRTLWSASQSASGWSLREEAAL